MKKKTYSTAEAGKQREFKRRRWKHFARWCGFIIIIGLNVSLIASNNHLRAAGRIDLAHEFSSYLLLVFVNLFFLLPTVLEVDKAVVTSDALLLSLLLWRTRLPWAQIKSCIKPAWLAFAIVKAPQCFYLINRRDIPEFADLLEIIQFQRQKADKGSYR